MNITQVDGNQTFVLDYLTYQPSFSSLSSKPNFTASALSGSESSSTSLPSPSNTGVAVAVNHSMKTRAIIGGVVGGVLGVALIVALFFLLWRRRNRQAYHEGVEKSSRFLCPLKSAGEADSLYTISPPTKHYNSSRICSSPAKLLHRTGYNDNFRTRV